MRVERSTESDVMARLKLLTKNKEAAAKEVDMDEEENFCDMVKLKDEENRKQKEERKRLRKERKAKKKLDAAAMGKPSPTVTEQSAPTDSENIDATREAQDVMEEGGIDPAMAAMMGFSGFGGSKKT